MYIQFKCRFIKNLTVKMFIYCIYLPTYLIIRIYRKLSHVIWKHFRESKKKNYNFSESQFPVYEKRKEIKSSVYTRKSPNKQTPKNIHFFPRMKIFIHSFIQFSLYMKTAL